MSQRAVAKCRAFGAGPPQRDSPTEFMGTIRVPYKIFRPLMNQPPVITSRPIPPGNWWVVPLVGALALAAVPVSLVLLVWSCLRTGSDATALRQAATQASGIKWERQVELSAGRIPVALARFGLNFAPLDPTARQALSVVRSAEVAVFDAPERHPESERATILQEADATMKKRGWERIVSVLQDDAVVAIYTPQSASSHDDLTLCVLVLSDDKLVVASARANPAPLLELIRNQMPRDQVFAWTR